MAYMIRPQVLDKIRALHGFTSDEQLAHEMGLSLGTVSRIRRGAEPSFRTAIKLLEAAQIHDVRAGIGKTPDPLAA